MFNIFCGCFGLFIGFFFGFNIVFDDKLKGMEKWWGCLVASIIISVNFVMLVKGLKEFFTA